MGEAVDYVSKRQSRKSPTTGDILFEDLRTIAPFENPIWILPFTGAGLRSAFDELAETMLNDGHFLHVSAGD